MFFVEDVQYQKATIEEVERALLAVVAMKPQTDKRARLQVVAPYIKSVVVLFHGRDASSFLPNYSGSALKRTMTSWTLSSISSLA
jgi:hypothetical protein